MGKFYEDLKAGLEDAIAYEQGKITLRTYTYEVPDQPVAPDAKKIKKFSRAVDIPRESSEL